jgi:hypothetical protein
MDSAIRRKSSGVMALTYRRLPRRQAQRKIPAVASTISFYRSIAYRDQGCM